MPNTHAEDFHKACQNIVDNREAKTLNYAVNYAKAGLIMYTYHEMRVQALYILNNIQYWRGDIAKETRATLKQVSKL